MSEGAAVMRLIADLPEDSQKRVWVMFQILTDLIRESGEEAELAFTLVMAGLADASEPETASEPDSQCVTTLSGKHWWIKQDDGTLKCQSCNKTSVNRRAEHE